jgi:hypothetical protein
LDYGATGDGRNDDSSAVQRAIDKIAASGGGALSFPAGRDYLLNRQITLCDNLTLIAPEKRARLVVGQAFSNMLQPLFRNFEGREINLPGRRIASRNIAFVGLEIDGRDVGVAGGTLAQSAMRGAMLCLGGWADGSGVQNALVHDCHLHSFAGAGVMIWRSTGVTISDCQFENFFADAKLSIGSSIDFHQVTNGVIRGNRIQHSAAGLSWHGIVVLDWDSGSGDIRIEDNVIAKMNGGDGISCEGNGGTGANLHRGLIRRNVISDCNGQGIGVDNCGSVTVEDNRIDRVTGPAILFSGTPLAVIQRNEIWDSGFGGIVSHWGTRQAKIRDNRVSGIRQHDFNHRGDGINVTATGAATVPDLEITGNMVSDVDGTGIYQTPARGTVARNTIIDAGKSAGLDASLRAGIIAAEPTRVTDNEIRSAGATCYAISSAASNFPNIASNRVIGRFARAYFYIGYRADHRHAISINAEEAAYDAGTNVFRGRHDGVPPGYWYKGDTFFTTARTDDRAPRVTVTETPSRWQRIR